MTNKQRVYAALEGWPVDRFPVTVLYSQLYHLDHFAELTGLPAWARHQWLCASPEEHVGLLRSILAAVPLETVQPQIAPPRAWRERQEFVVREGHPHRHDRGTDEWVRLDLPTISGHATDYAANDAQYVFGEADVVEKVVVTPAEELVAEGMNDYVVAAVEAMGEEQFILSGGVVGTVYACGAYVGQANLLAMLIEQPDLVEHLCGRVLEQNLEVIRALARAGGDAIYIDDATATSDMISPAHYERFSLPYVREMVREIHRLGHKAILIYFGGIADRLDLIATTGADALSMETSMKGYVNDIGDIAARLGDRMALFGNLDPVWVLEKGSEAELEAEIVRQVDAGRRARGFLVCTGSPVTPATPLDRIHRFLELGRSLGRTPAGAA